MEELKLKPKTINYLNTSANKAEELFAKAIEYRQHYENAKTNVAKELYAKKLKKVIGKLDPMMKMFSELEKVKKAKNESKSSEEEE